MSNNGGRRRVLKRVYRSPLTDIFQFSLLALLVIWFFVRSTENLGYNWQWGRIPAFLFSLDENGLTWGPLMQGLLVTFQISGISLVRKQHRWTLR